MSRSVHVIIQGEVQGVGYRDFAQREAMRLGLCGWVRNLRDGRVEAYAEGDEASLNEWLARLHRGPSSVRVKEVLPVWGEAAGSQGFEVRSTAIQQEPFR